MGSLSNHVSSLSGLANALASAFNQPSQPNNTFKQGYAYPSTYYASNSPNFSLIQPTLYDQQGYRFVYGQQNNPALKTVNYYPEYVKPDISQFDLNSNAGINQIYSTDLIKFSQTQFKAVGDYQLPQYQRLHGYDPFELKIFTNSETAQGFLNKSNQIMSGILGRQQW